MSAIIKGVTVKKTVSAATKIWNYVEWKAARDNHNNHSRVVYEVIEERLKKDRAYRRFLSPHSKSTEEA